MALSANVTFAVVDQSSADTRLWSRLIAHGPDSRRANGMNVSRFEGDLIAEEWAIWSDWRIDGDGGHRDHRNPADRSPY